MRSRQRGATAVEFALVAMILFILLIGIMEIARVMFIWNAANEATRYGARVAVVCTVDPTKALVTAKMRRFLPTLTADNVDLEYLPSPTAVELVRVSVTNLSVQTFIPVFAFNIPVPRSTAAIPSESLAGTAGDSYVCNPAN